MSTTKRSRQYHCLVCLWSGNYTNFEGNSQVCPLCDSEVVRIDKVNKERKKIIKEAGIKLNTESENNYV